MKTSKKLSRIQVLLLSLISSVAFPSHVGAQPVMSGKFTLSGEAKWGSVVLPAGVYTYALEDGGSPPQVTIYDARGNGKGVVFAAYVSEVTSPETARMTLEVKDGEAAVTALYVRRLGIMLHYNAEKPKREMAGKKTTPEPKAGSYAQAK